MVVRVQQVLDDQKEIEQPALLEGRTNWHAPVALTYRIVLDVRMRNTFVRRSRIGVECDHAVVVRMAVDQIAPFEPDLERPKIDAFQLDRFGRD